MVVKKKKIPEDSSATKRKADGDAEASSTEKKAKLDTPPS
jgi:HAT1-interacting factor 1